ncbi:hypothetical protein [Actinomadura fibrosa]|uniref:Uncharacterized protein n=1 Tax=Actinomadura fibrosa TaxID=111802 RepID=A0ABW2XGM0_9ACTN|nr:hypothetical protein [Actinomadura fibrosa]
MGEFDLDPRVEGAAGFGWEAHFRGAAPGPGGMRMADDSDGCVYACDPTWHTCSCIGCGPTAACSHTCGATGNPCLC